MGRLDKMVVIVVGAGQTPGPNLGTGKAASILYAREGCRVFAVDQSMVAAEKTASVIRSEGGDAVAWRADATDDVDVVQMAQACERNWGQIDILHNNVGASLASGDGPLSRATAESFDRTISLNLKTAFLTAKHVIPIMRRRGRGVVINISSIGAMIECPNIVYKAAKAGLNALTTQLAIENAPYGVRVNAILPGQISTSMLIEHRVGKGGATRDDVIKAYDGMVPLKGGMANAWAVAKAAVFLASDDASYITGVLLPVDGGQSLRFWRPSELSTFSHG